MRANDCTQRAVTKVESLWSKSRVHFLAGIRRQLVVEQTVVEVNRVRRHLSLTAFTEPSMSIEKLVLSPDAVLRFRSGRAVVHNPYSAEAALETDEPAVLGLLMRFARPVAPGLR